jgi:NADPH:quinone reductase-like Zn-dependent oxidoreductase
MHRLLMLILERREDPKVRRRPQQIPKHPRLRLRRRSPRSRTRRHTSQAGRPGSRVGFLSISSPLDYPSRSVVCLSHHYSLSTNNPSHGAFQLYSATNALVVQKIPSSLPYTDAAVLPLAISTAANVLYNKKTLALPYPSVPAPKDTGKSVLVWGGASSVGATAIQLAAASGVKVVSVSSTKNIPKVKALGAHAVFGYDSPTVVEDILAALKGTEYLGVADCISSSESAAGWTPVYEALGGRWAGVVPDPQGIPEGAEGEVRWAATIPFGDRDIGKAVWGAWVSEALEKGVLRAKPDAVVVGKGLERFQEAMDRQMRGVSFEKIVVEL